MIFIGGNAPPEQISQNIQKVQKGLYDDWNNETEKNTSEKKRVLPKYYKGNFKTKNAFNKFNNLFNKDENANKVKEITDYLKTGKIPEYIDVDNDTNATAKLNKFISDVDYFYLKDDRLYLKTWDLEVISKEKISQVLKKEYDHEGAGLGSSVVKFYKKIRETYLGITRNDVKEFLNQQSVYQIVKPFKPKTNMPIVSKYSNSIWCIDLIDFNSNLEEGNPKKLDRYIQTCLDLFSGKVWLRSVKTNSSYETTKALKSVIIDENGLKPKYIICDNGPEYDAEFAKFCKEKEIKIRNTRTYSPTGNPSERANQTVRKIIRSFVLKHKDRNFNRYVENTQNNMNESFIQAKKATPNQLWSPTTSEEDLSGLDLKSDERGLIPHEEMRKRLVANLMKHNTKLVQDYNVANEFKTGDLVRVNMASLFSNVRRIEKEGNGKLIVIKYTPEIFKISESKNKKQGLPRRRKYVVESIDGKMSFYKPRLIDEKDKKGKKKIKFTKYSFWAKELLSANGQDRNKKEMSLQSAMKLNDLDIITKDSKLRDVVLKTLPKRKVNQQEFIEEDNEEDDKEDDVPPPEIIKKVQEATKQSRRIRKQPVLEEPSKNVRSSGRTQRKEYSGGNLKVDLLNNLFK